jgi:Flp pilus assembly protein TadG
MDPAKGKKRRRSQSGAELLEVSLIALPLFGMIFLLLDLSMVIFLRSTFQQAVREGVRYGITGANDTGPCQDDSIKAIVKKNAIGFLNSTSEATTMHVHFMSPVTGAVSNNQPGNIIEVSVEAYKYGPMAPYGHIGGTYMWARAYDVVEPYPGTAPCLTVSE